MQIDFVTQPAAERGVFFQQAALKCEILPVPSPARVSELHADYNAMRDMFIRPPPPFNEVIATLAELERRINEEAPR